MVSNNSTKRRQNGFKIGTRDKFATHLSQENLISNEIVIYTIFLRSAIFPYNSLYTQAVAYTTYFELEEPVFSRETKTKKLKLLTNYNFSCTDWLAHFYSQ